MHHPGYFTDCQNKTKIEVDVRVAEATITMLAVPLSGRGESSLDPAVLLEIPVESTRTTEPELCKSPQGFA
ncbi:unnamed protein product [Echinostoma caproni]|uniref:Uncharacterized protein n=1 Tax=Echinostoma caproni TaxID=27848 RepID=A0A183B506_9TREM|nr:unnamed protein product [Echinostoma caproni]